MKMRLLGVVVISILILSSELYAADTLKIGVSLGLSGKYAKLCDMQKKAYLLWEEATNNAGGLMGKKVKMIIEDDKSDKIVAKGIYERFIVKEKLDLIIGPYSSGITNAIMPVAEKHGYPVIAAGAASDKLWEKGYQNLFGIFIPASRYAVGFLEMVAMKGIEDVAIVYADDIFSSTIGFGAKKWGEEFGLNVVVFESFKKGTHDLSSIANKVKASDVKALVLCGHYVESVDMMHAFGQINWRPKNFFATIGPAMNAFYEEFKESGEKVFSSSQWEPGIRYKQDDDQVFLIPFKKKYAIDPSYHAADAFAACQILATAIKRTKSFNRDTIRGALAKMDAMSIIGRYGVDANGKQIKHFPINIQWQNGKKEIVWPESVASANPIIN